MKKEYVLNYENLLIHFTPEQIAEMYSPEELSNMERGNKMVEMDDFGCYEYDGLQGNEELKKWIKEKLEFEEKALHYVKSMVREFNDVGKYDEAMKKALLYGIHLCTINQLKIALYRINGEDK